MANGTFAAIGTTVELPFVRILVAVHALRKWNGRLKVPVRMTVAACNGRMFAQQRKLCLCMIESLQLSDLIPFCCVVARLTGGAKAALVGIRVARRAFGERQANVLHIRLRVGDGRMTLRARSFFVGSGERKFCLGVAKE
jgi:hypothetical protein